MFFICLYLFFHLLTFVVLCLGHFVCNFWLHTSIIKQYTHRFINLFNSLFFHRQHSHMNPLSTQVEEERSDEEPFTEPPSPPGSLGHLWNGWCHGEPGMPVESKSCAVIEKEGMCYSYGAVLDVWMLVSDCILSHSISTIMVLVLKGNDCFTVFKCKRYCIQVYYSYLNGIRIVLALQIITHCLDDK